MFGPSVTFFPFELQPRTHTVHPKMPTTFSGSLQAKKKSELQDIAIALDIADSGTREDLQNRIKQHLSQNEAELSEDPRFAGLLSSRGRKRSVQPQMLTTYDARFYLSYLPPHLIIQNQRRRPVRDF